jgi:hypothetical protein
VNELKVPKVGIGADDDEEEIEDDAGDGLSSVALTIIAAADD